MEMVIPWQLCRTIGPLLSQRLPLASAKAQPREISIQGNSGPIVLHKCLAIATCTRSSPPITVISVTWT